MFSRDTSEVQYKKLLGGALVAGCVFAGYMVNNQNGSIVDQEDVLSPQLEQQQLTYLAQEDEDEEPLSFEEIIEDHLMNLRSKTYKECQAIYERRQEVPKNSTRNIEKILQGYNIFKGSPFAKEDTGFAGRIFTFDWTNIKQDSNHKMYPKEANVEENNRCFAETKTETIIGEQTLQKSFAAGVSVGASASVGVYSGAFSASADFKRASKEMKNSKVVRSYATSQCVKYRYRLKTYMLPCLSEEITEAIKEIIQDANKPEEMNTFLDEFGTHGILGVDMGGKYVATTKFSALAMSNYKAQEVGVKFSIEGGGWGVQANASSHVNHESKQFQSKQNLKSQSECYTIGTPLPSNKGSLKQQIDEWNKLQQGKDAILMPVGHMKLKPLHKILKTAFRHMSWRSAGHKQFLTRLKQQAESRSGYCGYLMRNGQLKSCDKPIPGKLPAPTWKKKTVKTPVRGNDNIRLEKEHTGKGLNYPSYLQGGWPTSQLRRTHKTHKIVLDGRGTGFVYSGSTYFGLKVTSTPVYNYDWLYCPKNGYGYYMNSMASVAQWQFTKKGGGTIHYGDMVKISNRYWPKASLYSSDNNWLMCGNSQNTYWRVHQ